MANRGRRSNAVDSHAITVSVSLPLFKLLTKIAQTGFAGRTEAAVAEEMIRKGLNADGLLSEILKNSVLPRTTRFTRK